MTNTPNERLLATSTLRAFFALAASASALGAIHTWVVPSTLSPGYRLLLASLFMTIGGICLLALRLPARLAQQVMLPTLVAALVAIGATALASGWGLRAPGLYFFGVVCCMTFAVARQRHGVVVTLVAMGLVLVLAAAEWHGVVPPSEGPGLAPMLSRVLVQLASIAVGAGAGLVLSRLSWAYVRQATEREERFRDLLGIAAAAYWETDDTLRITHVSRRHAQGEFVPMAITAPETPWGATGLHFDEDVLDRVRAEMEAREPLRDVPMRWTSRSGTEQRLLASGEPRFDPIGRFQGYWGVARDVTSEHLARAALIDTELRYRDLFRRTPTAMLLHRDDRVVDANDAAAELLGAPGTANLAGHPLQALFVQEDRARVDDLHCRLMELPIGEALTLADTTLLGLNGQHLVGHATSVRANIGGQHALLTIFADETAQRAAASAHERSEALLRQVVSMSPDVITLTDLSTGRYEMVNDSFTRVSGYVATEVIGRTAQELGIWASTDDRDRLLARLRESDTVKDLALGFVHRDGHRLPMLVSASRFEREGRHYLVINARDTSEANRERLEREAVMANASVGIAYVRDQHIAMINPRMERMFGWPPGELVGQPARAMWPDAVAFDSLMSDVGQVLGRGAPLDIERQARRRDGSAFLVRLRATTIDPRGPTHAGSIWVAEDVTKQREAEAELARARDQAEAANRAKSAFLANTSHEIRTPLNGLVGLARMARAPDVPPQRMKQYLDQIGDSAETLSMIISDILDLSKIEAGRLEVEREPFDLLALLHSLHRAYASMATARDLDFEMTVDPRVPELVCGDALRVRQVLVNLLHNALKFTAKGGIRMTVDTVGVDTVRFEVWDTGPGIDAATQARLFKPFTQADESITRRFGGTGLGLSICRELATLMGGTVGVASSIGQGSCFHAELPLPAVGADDPSSGFGALDSDLLHGCRVLMVEDNAVNMMIGVALLQQWGIQVSEAENGSLALLAIEDAAAAGRHFHAVMMDVQMPGMSGYEATRRLRERWSSQQLPVIAITAAALVSEREEALAAGMNDFVTKPIDPDRLRRALLRALSTDLD